MQANPKPTAQPETTLASRFAPKRPCMCSCGWPHQTMHSMNGAPLRGPRIFRQKRYAGPSGPRSLPVPSEINAHSTLSMWTYMSTCASRPRAMLPCTTATCGNGKCAFISLAGTCPWASISEANIAHLGGGKRMARAKWRLRLFRSGRTP